jgi:hypothetical protein
MSIHLGKSKKDGFGNQFENTRISILPNEKNTSKISENEEIKNNKLLDRLFNKIGSDVKKLRKFGRNVYIENEKNEFNICRKIDYYIKNVDNENFASAENNSNAYELVEKHDLDILVSENNNLNSNINDINSKIDEINKIKFKLNSEENFLKHAVDSNKKSQVAYKPKSVSLTEEIKKAKITGRNLNKLLSNEKIQNDNMLQAVKSVLKQINNEIFLDFEETLKKYDNEYFVDKQKNMKDHKIIEELLGKIDQLEKEKFAKEIEIKNFKLHKHDNPIPPKK